MPINKLVICRNQRELESRMTIDNNKLNRKTTMYMTYAIFLEYDISMLADIYVLECRDCGIKELPQTLHTDFKKLLELKCSMNRLKKLPLLPPCLKVLDCYDNLLTELPPLPATLMALHCNKNRLSSLPIDIAQKTPLLTRLDCSENAISKLPQLPHNLLYLTCNKMKGKEFMLPSKLPNTLRDLEIRDTLLKCLPDPLPPNIEYLIIGYTADGYIPDLPDSIISLNTLCHVYTIIEDDMHVISQYRSNFKNSYPLLQSCFMMKSVEEECEYINQCNSERRCRERLAIINQNAPFLEHYMRRMMHPNRLQTLKINPHIDVDAFMENYSASL